MGFDPLETLNKRKKKIKLEYPNSIGDCFLAFLKPHLGAAALANATDSGRTRLMVFVHGGKGDHIDTWFNKHTDTYWPKLVRYDTANFGLVDVAVFDYSSKLGGKELGVQPIAVILRDLLVESNAADYDDIVFVAHSLGGVVTRQLLIDLAKNNEPLFGKIRLVASMACAYRGTFAAGLLSWLGSQNEQLDDITVGSDFLIKLNEAWDVLRKNENPQQKQRPFVWAVRGENDQAVLEDSALKGCDSVLRILTSTGSIVVTDEHWELGSDAFSVNDTSPSLEDTNSETLFPRTISLARPDSEAKLNHTAIVKPDNVSHAAHQALREAYRLAVSNG